MGSFQTPLPVILLGAIIGINYGLVAMGLVLIFRTSGIINFAQSELGIIAAVFLALAIQRWHVPFYVALPFVLLAGAGVAVVVEMVVIRRLRKAPRLISIVATLGVAQVLISVSGSLTNTSTSFPSPPGLPQFNVGALTVTQPYVGALIFGPVAVVALTIFLRKSRYGLALRCASDNPEAARMAGISPDRMSMVAWGIAGVLSVGSAITVLGASGSINGAETGPDLLLRALAAAVIARMSSLPVAFISGIGVGIVEQVLLWNYPTSPGLVEVLLYAVIVVALLLQRPLRGRDRERGSWAGIQTWRPLPEAVAQLREVRWMPFGLLGALLAVGLLLPALVTNATAFILSSILALSIIGLSVGIVTGLGGQLSLGQFAVAAVGAVASYQVARGTGNFFLAVLAAGFAGSVVSLGIGLPALRLRGLMLTVTTLGFALVTTEWLLGQPWAFGAGIEPGQINLFGYTLTTEKSYYYYVLGLFVVALLLARNIRVGGLGRKIKAVRDNEDNARAFTVSARTVKLQGFMLAGFIAGIGGCAYGQTLTQLSSLAFGVQTNIDIVAMSVIGGISLLVGPLIGAFYIIGVPAFLPLNSAGLAATSLGWLLLILYLPGGFPQAIEPIRTRWIQWVARRHDIDLKEAEESSVLKSVRRKDAEEPSALKSVRPGTPIASQSPRAFRGGDRLLEIVDLHKRYGGIAAVDGVSADVLAGEILGLIGPNGAGKTTLFELLGGFSRADSGRVIFEGRDISRLSPEERGRLGVIRSFQDAMLFPTMTVLDVVRLSFERRRPTRLVASVLGLPGSERDKSRRARDVVGVVGLDAYRNKQIQELSTGTRRVTEIACLMAMEPTLLLLDEPSSGIAQRETEALGIMLLRLRKELNLTMLVIEHDMPLIMGLSDRILAMDAGQLIANGRPDVVRADPRVVDAYLGASTVALERSGGVSSRPDLSYMREGEPPGGAIAEGHK